MRADYPLLVSINRSEPDIINGSGSLHWSNRILTHLLSNAATKCLLFILSISYSGNVYCQNRTGLFVPELPYTHQNSLHQQIGYRVSRRTNVTISLSFFLLKETDSTALYNASFNDIDLKKGVHNLTLDLQKNSALSHADYSFYEVVKRFDLIPPGSYSLVLRITSADTNISSTNYYQWSVDSNLAVNSGLRGNFNAVLGEGKLTVSKKAGLFKRPDKLSKQELRNASSKVSRKIDRVSGTSSIQETKEGKSYTAVYYKGWFLGRYEIRPKQDMNETVSAEKRLLNNSPVSFVKGDLGDPGSLGAQMKKLNKDENKEKPIRINLDMLTNVGSGQDPGSQQDNNYQEIHADVQTKILGLPVGVEGFYTTQDRNRKAKASYIRLHYDIDEAKSELQKQVSQYQGKYNELKDKSKGVNGYYRQLVQQVYSEKALLLSNFTKNYHVDRNFLEQYGGDVKRMLPAMDTAELKRKLMQKAYSDTTTAEAKAKIEKRKTELLKEKQKLEADSAKIRADYEKVIALQKKIDKYQRLLEQYNDRSYMDSALNYQKLIDANKKDPDSYKSLAKAASGILPDGKVSKFVSGITNLDAGIINKYESDYTNAGQNLKGASMGYDLGLVKTSVALGKTEYVSRDGNVDQYNSLMTRLDFKAVAKQKIGLIYYAYAPTKKMITSDNFFKSDASLPSFESPMHIISLIYDGSITKDITLHSEAAQSFRNGDKISNIEADKSALKGSLEYALPFYPASLSAEYEHMGKDFQNSVLPVIVAGTDRYTLDTRTDLFNSFVSIGVQYNFIKQQTFYSTGYNTKWGFDIRTHSKQYPNVLLSYKPFSTFRSYNDTLAIPQKPMVGEVWIGRASYQFKRNKVSHCFSVSYNQNSSTMDTVTYKSKTLQCNYIRTDKNNIINLSSGWMQMPVSDTTGLAKGNTYFFSTNISRRLTEKLMLNLGQDISLAKFGLQRIATTVGCNYAFNKFPIAIRFSIRYTNYKLTEQESNVRMWYGQLGINWRFKGKLN